MFALFGRPALSLALQGGGAHGAFTWGVLDALLEDGRFDFEAISGTSAGAMNAVVCAHGLMTGGRDGARAALAAFWEAVAASSPFDMSGASSGDPMSLSPTARMLLHWSRHFSPYQLNPFDLNPLRDVVQAHIDFERLRKHSPVKLFIAATRVNSGRLRLFRERELTPEMLMASACLPTLHRTVEVDGEAYWDGGYSANPAVFPLCYECRGADILLVLLTPLSFGDTPQSAEDIQQRALELAFCTNFMREMLAFQNARKFAAAKLLPLGALERRLLKLRFHMVGDDALAQLDGETRLIANLGFFEQLRDQGRARAAAWLAGDARAVGKRGSVDLERLFA